MVKRGSAHLRLPFLAVETQSVGERAKTAFAFAVLLGAFAGISGVVGRAAGTERSVPQQSEPSAGQQAAPGTVARPIGTIQAIHGNTLTLKTDAGSEVNVAVQDSARLVRIEPGQKTLQGATTVRLEDLQVGDRILVGGKVSEDGKSVLASMVVLMKRSDIAQKQEQEQEDWQKHSVGGLVSAVDPAGGTITITTRVAGANKTMAIHTTRSTIIRRYAPDSVRFSDARPGTLDQIKPGDQLRARGIPPSGTDGSELAAEEIVSGSFRNIAGTVLSVDPGANEISVMDLITKRPVVVKFTADSRLRKLPPTMAQMIAMRLKGGQPGSAAAGGGSPGEANRGGTGSESVKPPSGDRSASGAGGGRPPGGAGGGAPDLQRLLSRLPAATPGDLQKGEAVMIVSTEGAASGAVTAITLLSGVEPILTAAPAGSEAMTLSPWSLSAPAGDTGTP
jgi:hypothetical protein